MKTRTFAMIGNPNSGKTTLFNCLTGASQHVGNWPGVTVERKLGQLQCGGQSIRLTDLPGVYSLSPYTQEEVIAREYVLSEEPDGILNVVDAAHLERNLYLTVQLLSLGRPMIVALNCMDDCRKQGIVIDCARLSRRLGVRVVPVTARTGENLDMLRAALAGVAEPPLRQPPYPYGVGAAIAKTVGLLRRTSLRRESLPFYAAKLLEQDTLIVPTVRLSPDTERELACVAREMAAAELDREMLLADARYVFVEEVLRETVWRTAAPHKTVTERIDCVVLHRVLALPIFGALMALMFWTTFGPIGSGLSIGLKTLLQGGIAGQARRALLAAHTEGWLTSLLCDGVLGGVGGVIGFLPQILLLFGFLSVLEDTGYLARIAFIMDAPLRRIGLSGKSFVPMLMGFGCTTPAVMAARTMEKEQERYLTVLLTPYMSCGAKLPVYALFAGTLFSRHQGLVIGSLYLLGLAGAIIAGFVLQKAVFREASAGFVLELPPYRLPTGKGTMRALGERTKDFLTKAGTVIFLMSVLVWFLQHVTPALQATQEGGESLLGALGKGIAPVFRPLGFGFWQAAVALLTGIVAKETVVSTIGVLYGTGGDFAALHGILRELFTPLSAYAFLVFLLLYTPCISALTTMKRELGSWKMTLCAALFQTEIAYFAALLVYQLGRLL